MFRFDDITGGNNAKHNIPFIKYVWRFTENVQRSYILFWLLILLYQLIIIWILEKSFRLFIKMALTDELKAIDNKSKANQAQYNLERQAAKISTWSFKELDKYEYFNDEDLRYNLGVGEEAKVEYSPLGKALITD